MYAKMDNAVKIYAIKAGRVPGLYHTWAECKAAAAFLADRGPMPIKKGLPAA